MSRVRGFSLIELMVVMAVLGLLAAAAFPMAEVMRQRERERELKQALWEIRSAIDAYKRAYDEGRIARSGPLSGYPPALEALALGAPSAVAASARVYFLRRVPRDPFAPPEVPAEASWALRSFDSPPERPAPGADVFDVHSRSDSAALDGTLLRSW
jgi:general secretion pathway protein G